MLDVVPIGIAGYAGAGKDAVADVLVRYYGYTKRSYSDVVKESLYAALPRDVRRTFPQFLELLDARKRLPPEADGAWARSLLQSWAMALRELGGADYWVHRLPIVPGLVIPAVRFHNEVRHLQSHGAVIWRVTRPGVIPQDHPSERDIPSLAVDADLTNDGTLRDLASQVHDLIADLGRARRLLVSPDDASLPPALG